MPSDATKLKALSVLQCMNWTRSVDCDLTVGLCVSGFLLLRTCHRCSFITGRFLQRGSERRQLPKVMNNLTCSCVSRSPCEGETSEIWILSRTPVLGQVELFLPLESIQHSMCFEACAVCVCGCKPLHCVDCVYCKWYTSIRVYMCVICAV